MFSLTRFRDSTSRAALVICLTLLALGGCSRGATKPASSISEADRGVLVQYEALRAALADDDMRKAHLAGEKLLKAIDAPGVSPAIVKTRAAARVTAEIYRIELSRAALKEISAALAPICQGVEGYYIVTTDLVVDGLWVQTSPVISNPYLGRSMSLYGEIKR